MQSAYATCWGWGNRRGVATTDSFDKLVKLAPTGLTVSGVGGCIRAVNVYNVQGRSRVGWRSQKVQSWVTQYNKHKNILDTYSSNKQELDLQPVCFCEQSLL